MAEITQEESLRLVSTMNVGRLVTLSGYYYRYDDANEALYTWAGDVLKPYARHIVESSFTRADHQDTLRVADGL